MSDHIQIPPYVADQVVDGEAVLLNLRTGVYFGLNGTGTRAWGILKRTGDPAQLLNEMQHCYGEHSATLPSDLLAWLGELEQCGLILRTHEPHVTAL